MFLDEKLYTIGKSVNMDSRESIMSTIRDMIKESFSHIDENKDANGTNLIPLFERTDLYWRRATKMLLDDGIDLVEPDGFKNLVKSKESFKGIFL